MAERTFGIAKIGKWSLVGLRVAGLLLAGYLLFSLSALYLTVKAAPLLVPTLGTAINSSNTGNEG